MKNKQKHCSINQPMIPNVCLLLACKQLCEALSHALDGLGLSAVCYQDDQALFAAIDPAEIDCLVLATGGVAALDGLTILEGFKQLNICVPALVIVNDDAVNQAVRVMRALASECLAGHTPVPIIARQVRTLAQSASLTRAARAALQGAVRP